MTKEKQQDHKYNTIFRTICANDLNLMNPSYPLPAKGFRNISYYMARKLCNELKQEGLITFLRDYIPAQFSYEGELENEPFFICGWITTEEGRKTEIWKQEEIKEEKI